MRANGPRFDLAVTLARELQEVDRLGTFLAIIRQVPVLSQVRSIAEPWDLGERATRSETSLWAGQKVTSATGIRGVLIWKGDRGLPGDLAYCITRSSELTRTAASAPVPASILSPCTTASVYST